MSTEEILIAETIATWTSYLKRANKLFTDLDATLLEQEILPHRNRMVYIWGHLTAMHDRMLQLLGVAERVHPDFDAVFLTSPDKTQDLPAVEVIQAWWDEVNRRLDEGISQFTATDWIRKHGAVSDEDFAKDPLRNRLAILLTRTNHLAYHLGQAALAPK